MLFFFPLSLAHVDTDAGARMLSQFVGGFQQETVRTSKAHLSASLFLYLSKSCKHTFLRIPHLPAKSRRFSLPNQRVIRLKHDNLKRLLLMQGKRIFAVLISRNVLDINLCHSQAGNRIRDKIFQQERNAVLFLKQYRPAGNQDKISIRHKFDIPLMLPLYPARDDRAPQLLRTEAALPGSPVKPHINPGEATPLRPALCLMNPGQFILFRQLKLIFKADIIILRGIHHIQFQFIFIRPFKICGNVHHIGGKPIKNKIFPHLSLPPAAWARLPLLPAHETVFQAVFLLMHLRCHRRFTDLPPFQSTVLSTVPEKGFFPSYLRNPRPFRSRQDGIDWQA